MFVNAGDESSPLSVLIVDDDPGDVHLLCRLIERIHDWRISVRSCASPNEALSILKAQKVDIVLVDHRLGPSSGMDLLRELAGSDDQARALIMITGSGDEEIAAEAIKAGALEYITKLRVNADVLRDAFVSALERAERRRLVTEHRDELVRLAYRDEVSGLRNRRSFTEWIGVEVSRSRRYGTALWLLMIDLDDFKSINDSEGHLGGDLILRGFGSIVLSMLRSTDAAARFGGDEFCIAMTEQTAEGVEVFAERLRERVRITLSYSKGGRRVPVTCSIGVAPWNPGMESAQDLFEAADRALYDSKDGGRDRVTILTRSSV